MPREIAALHHELIRRLPAHSNGNEAGEGDDKRHSQWKEGQGRIHTFRDDPME